MHPSQWGRCGPGRHAPHRPDWRHHRHAGDAPGDDFMGSGPDADDGGFGVRRPLRFLAHRLSLSDDQVTALARVLDRLKTERAQAAVDGRRALSEFADAVAADPFDAPKARAAGDARVRTAERLRDAVLTALGEIHALLTADQRARLAYLLRTGALVV